MSKYYDSCKIVGFQKGGDLKIYEHKEYPDETPFYSFEASGGGYYEITSLLKMKGLKITDFEMRSL